MRRIDLIAMELGTTMMIVGRSCKTGVLRLENAEGGWAELAFQQGRLKTVLGPLAPAVTDATGSLRDAASVVLTGRGRFTFIEDDAVPSSSSSPPPEDAGLRAEDLVDLAIRRY